MISYADELFDYFLSDSDIGFNVKDVLERLKRARAKVDRLYQAGEWRSLPDRLENGYEQKFGQYIENIGQSVDKRLSKELRSKRKRWSATFSGRAVPDPSHGRKPSLVMVDNGFDDKYESTLPANRDADNFGWWRIQGIIEVKKSMDDYGDALEQVQEYTRLIFRHQPHRRYVISAAILGTEMQLIVFDRSGGISTSFFNINKNPVKFLRVVLGLLLIDDAHLGLDETVQFMMRNAGTIKVGGISYNFTDVLYVEPVVCGRGTACYVIERDSDLHLVKDSWIDDSRDCKEGEILHLLRDKFAKKQEEEKRSQNSDEHVEKRDIGEDTDSMERPKELGAEEDTEMMDLWDDNKDYLAGFDLLNHIPNIVVDEAIEVDGHVDSTAILRKAHLTTRKDENGNDFRAWINPKYNKIVIRQHRRILVNPVGRGLEDFSCLGELLKGLIHTAKVLWTMFVLGYLHRDLSLRNILLRNLPENPTEADFHGLLIDFDYSAPVDNAPGPPAGTLPFMSIKALSARRKAQNDFIHMSYHDLESLVYVLIFIATMYSGPYSKIRVWEALPSDEYAEEVEMDKEKTGRKNYYKNTELAKWNGDTWLSESVLAASKYCAITYKNTFVNDMEANFEPYFKPLFGCIHRLRELIRPPGFTKADIDRQRYFIEMLKGIEPVRWDMIRSLKQSILLAERDPTSMFKKFVKILEDAYETLPNHLKAPEPRPGHVSDGVLVKQEAHFNVSGQAKVEGKDVAKVDHATKASIGPHPVPENACSRKRTRDELSIGRSPSKRIRKSYTVIDKRRAAGSRQSNRIHARIKAHCAIGKQRLDRLV